MKIERKVRAILRKAEADLLNAIATAAKAGDLGGVDEARSAAGRIRELIKVLDAPQRKGVALHARPEVRAEQMVHGKKGGNSNNYPRFKIRNETLYRVGWSRKKCREYEHKVPKQTVDSIGHAMKSLATTDGRLVVVEDIVARLNGSGVIQVPQYQVYIVVGWLAHHNCIEQVGRDGYKLPADIASALDQQWRNHAAQRV